MPDDFQKEYELPPHLAAQSKLPVIDSSLPIGLTLIIWAGLIAMVVTILAMGLGWRMH